MLRTVLYGKDCQGGGREPRWTEQLGNRKDPTVEDAIVGIEKAVKAIKPETGNPCWRRWSRCCAQLLRTYQQEPIKEIMKKICGYLGKRFCRMKGVKIGILEKFKSKQKPQQRNSPRTADGAERFGTRAR